MSSGQQGAQGESALQYQERMRHTQPLRDNWSHGALCPCTECHRNYREVDRATDRRSYVREHAPGIFAALLCQPVLQNKLERELGFTPTQHTSAQLRAQAIEQAGLLFDETEAK